MLVWLDRRFRLGHGKVFALYVVLYTAGRFWIEALRIDTVTEIAGFRLNNYTSLILFLAALVWLIWLVRNRPGREAVVEGPEPSPEPERSRARARRGFRQQRRARHDRAGHRTTGDPMKRLRLFHFDIKTYGNYGDTLLFEAVKQSFNGFAGGESFEVYDSRPLRDPVGPALVNYINDNFDAVVVGGGGLFLRDTNPNQRSGWQWNISLDQLRRLKKPLILFSVGNNRFIDQADFAPPFSEHVNLTMEKSVFFGLRNTGSMETIKPYIAEANRDRVEYQPCPTTISSYLFPDLVKAEVDPARRLGLEMIVGKRQTAAGFDGRVDLQRCDQRGQAAAGRGLADRQRAARPGRHALRRAGRPRAPADARGQALRRPRRAVQGCGVLRRPALLPGYPRPRPDGAVRHGRDPGLAAGAPQDRLLRPRPRPSGMGGRPAAGRLRRPAVRRAARGRGAPDRAADRAGRGAGAVLPRRPWTTWRRSTRGSPARRSAPEHTPYTPFERRLAERAYADSLARGSADERVRELTAELEAARNANEVPKVAEWLLARAQGAADQGDLTRARALLRGLDAAAPEFFNGKHRRPRWDEGAYRYVPAPVLQELRSRVARQRNKPPSS